MSTFASGPADAILNRTKHALQNSLFHRNYLKNCFDVFETFTKN